MSKTCESLLQVEKVISFQIVFYIKHSQGRSVGPHVQFVRSLLFSDRRVSSCTAASGFSWERDTLSFGGDARVKRHLLSQASRHAYKQEDRFCFSCVWAFCFSWGGEGALAFSDCSRKAESAYTLCPHGLSFHSAPFLTRRSSSFNSLFAHSCSFKMNSSLFSQPSALSIIRCLSYLS